MTQDCHFTHEDYAPEQFLIHDAQRGVEALGDQALEAVHASETFGPLAFSDLR